MLETMMASSTFVKCGVDGGTDPLRWDNQPFPSDSNSSFSPIKQEVVDTTYEGSGQSDFTELKAMQPFDYAGSLTGVDPCLSNNNNDTNNNNNSREKAINQHLNIYIKPLSPPTPSSRESFCFNASPSDVTSSGSISPPNITQLGPGIKIDFPNNQDEFDDIANIVGISCGMGADSTVPSHDTLENLDLDWTQIDAVPLKPVGGAGDHYESILPTSSGSENSITNVSMSSTHVGQPYLTNIPLALQALASSNKGMRAISLDPRDHPGNTTVNFSNISPILQHKLLTGSSTYNTSCYPPLPIKLEPPYEIKTEQHGYQNVIPDSTWGVDPHRHRPGLDILAGRSKQKQNRPKPVGYNNIPYTAMALLKPSPSFGVDSGRRRLAAIEWGGMAAGGRRPHIMLLASRCTEQPPHGGNSLSDFLSLWPAQLPCRFFF
jgi:hypothetical protein